MLLPQPGRLEHESRSARGAEAPGSRVAFPGDPKRPGTHGGPAPSRVRRDRALGQALPARGGAVRIRREYAIACDPVRALRVDGSRAGCGVAHVRLRSCGRAREPASPYTASLPVGADRLSLEIAIPSRHAGSGPGARG